MNFLQRFKSLPVSSRRLLSAGIIIAFVVALPLFIWAVINLNFNPFKRAASGEPVGCEPVGKTITVTPNSDTSGTCHSIQAAIDAVTGDGYTVKIQPGVYDVASTIIINGKSNISIVGSEYINVGAVVINRNNDFGILIQNSSGSIRWFTLQGGSANGMLSIHDSNNFTVSYANINSQSSHTLDVQRSSNINIISVEIQSSAGALEVDSSDHVQINYNKIHNSVNGISVVNSQDTQIVGNLIYSNNETGIRLTNIANLRVSNNTLYNNSKNGVGIPAVYASGTVSGRIDAYNNIIAFNNGYGISVSVTPSNLSGSFTHNDVYSNHANYLGVPDQTGINGNISQDPLFNSGDGSFCLFQGSPAVYGSITNGEYMGYLPTCGTYPTPLPSSFPTPSPTAIPTTPPWNYCPGPNGSQCSAGYCQPTPTCAPGQPCPQSVCFDIIGTCQNHICTQVTPTPIPGGNFCGGTCGNNYNCASGLICSNGFCRNPSCVDSANCSCGTPPPTVRPFVINFKFEGVSDNGASYEKLATNAAKVTVKFLSNALGYTQGYVTPPIMVDYAGNGIYTLHFGIWSTNIPASNDYSISLKGEKHIATKFCYSSGQTMHCTGPGSISIPANPSATVNLNFTGIPLQPGDLYPQDGAVTTLGSNSDFARLMTLLAKPPSTLTTQDLLVGDLDYNGVINIKDLFLLRQTLQTRYDEN